MGNTVSTALESPLSPRTIRQKLSEDPIGDYQYQRLQLMSSLDDKPVIVLGAENPGEPMTSSQETALFKIPYSKLLEVRKNGEILNFCCLHYVVSATWSSL